MKFIYYLLALITFAICIIGMVAEPTPDNQHFWITLIVSKLVASVSGYCFYLCIKQLHLFDNLKE